MKFIYIILFTLLLTSCFESNNWRDVKAIKSSGKIRVLTRNSSTSFYKDKSGEIAGFEHDLTQEFAKHLGVEVEYVIKSSLNELFKALLNGEGDLIASSLTSTPSRRQRFRLSPSYHKIVQKLVCKPGFEGDSIEDILGKNILVLKGSSYEEKLDEIRRRYPNLTWNSTADLSTEQILNLVWQKEVDCTVADSNIVSVHQRYMPELVVVKDMSVEQELAWFFHPSNQSLQDAVSDWMKLTESKSVVSVLKSKYFGYFNSARLDEKKQLKTTLNSKLPPYVSFFKKAANQYKVSWSLLVAISYMESRLKFKSLDEGGRGLMGLTKNLAKDLGVVEFKDPVQDIYAGARYLSNIFKKIPEYIPEDDQLKFSLASYVLGFDHMQNARKVAIDMNLNPNHWSSLVETLPLLSHYRYFGKYEQGYAPGMEAVVFVDRVLRYQKVIEDNF